MYYKNIDLDPEQVTVIRELEDHIASINQEGFVVETEKLARLFEKASSIVPASVLSKAAQSLLLQAVEMENPRTELFELGMEYTSDSNSINPFMCHMLVHLLRQQRYEESKVIAQQIISVDVETGARILKYLAAMSSQFPDATASIFESLFSSFDPHTFYTAADELYCIWTNENTRIREVMDSFFPGVHEQTSKLRGLLDLDQERVKEFVLSKLHDRIGTQHHASMTLQ